jgi:hypothetical protein
MFLASSASLWEVVGGEVDRATSVEDMKKVHAKGLSSRLQIRQVEKHAALHSRRCSCPAAVTGLSELREHQSLVRWQGSKLLQGMTGRRSVLCDTGFLKKQPDRSVLRTKFFPICPRDSSLPPLFRGGGQDGRPVTVHLKVMCLRVTFQGDSCTVGILSCNVIL